MIFVLIVIGILLHFQLHLIVCALWDSRDTLKDIQYRNFNIECSDPSDHFKFTVGDKK